MDDNTKETIEAVSSDVVEASENIGNAIVEAAPSFFDKLEQAAITVSTKLMEVAPQAADAILKLVQIKGAFYVFVATPFIILSVWAITYGNKKIYNIWQTNKNNYQGVSGYDPFLECLAMCGVTIVSAIVFCLAFFNGWTFYNWISMIYPEGAIALRALEAAGINL